MLQLQQEQLPQLPFEILANLERIDNKEKIGKTENGYIIIATDITIHVAGDLFAMANTLLALSKFKGFTHLMLKYVQ